MYNIDYCPACHSSNISKHPAYMYQFVAWRISGNKPEGDVPINGIFCHNCEFTCTESRIDEEEEKALYTNYRGEEYNSMRIECEPSYAAHLLNFDTEEYMKVRKYGINVLIEKNVDVSKIKTVLDYGGNKGEHIPPVFNTAERYVYDISDVDLLEGVKSFDPDNVEKMDFVMCCHVLEHKSEPDAIIEEIKKHIHEESWIYIEVPEYERYPLPGATFHEHINSFTDRSMWALLDRCGIEVVEMITTATGDGHIMCLLGKLK